MTNRHFSKISDAIRKLPEQGKGDVTVRIGPSAQLIRFADGTLSLKLYQTVVARYHGVDSTFTDGVAPGTLQAAHGGHRTATTMVWALSALEAFSRGQTFGGSRAKGTFTIEGVDIERTLTTVQKGAF